MSVLILNFSETKQYPLWWLGLGSEQQDEGVWGNARRTTLRAKKTIIGNAISKRDQGQSTNKLRPKMSVLGEREEEDRPRPDPRQSMKNLRPKMRELAEKEEEVV